MRIYVGDLLKSPVGTYVRCATFHSTAGHLELLPVSPCPKTRDSSGIFSALRLEGLSIGVLGRSNGFKFISVVFSELVFPQMRKWSLILRRASAFRNPPPSGKPRLETAADGSPSNRSVCRIALSELSIYSNLLVRLKVIVQI